MRGGDQQPEAMFSYVSMEDRIPQDHPLRAMRTLVDAVLTDMSPRFTRGTGSGTTCHAFSPSHWISTRAPA